MQHHVNLSLLGLLGIPISFELTPVGGYAPGLQPPDLGIPKEEIELDRQEKIFCGRYERLAWERMASKVDLANLWWDSGLELFTTYEMPVVESGEKAMDSWAGI